MTRAVGLGTNLRPNMVFKLTEQPGVNIARKLGGRGAALNRSVRPTRNDATGE